MNAVADWWQNLLPVVAPFLYKNGGNVVLVQLENEYGSYGNDKAYLSFLQQLLQKFLGPDVIFHSTDGYSDLFLLNSYIPGIFQVSITE